MAEVELVSRHVKSSMDQEQDVMIRSHKRLIENKMDDLASSFHNMFFQSLSDGELIFYDQRKLGFDNRLKDLVDRRNKYYLWLLVEAFEYFEDFLELIYAHMGHKEPSTWPPKEKKGETSTSLGQKDFEWFLDKSESNKKNNVKLDCIRKRFPSLAVIEKSNHVGIDFRFAICLVEMLRHVVVHNSGRILNVEKFVERIFEKAGMSNNGNYDPQKIKLVNTFVEPYKGQHRIIMLEIYQQGTPFHLSRLSQIINWLLTYADYIYRILIRPTYFAVANSNDNGATP